MPLLVLAAFINGFTEEIHLISILLDLGLFKLTLSFVESRESTFELVSRLLSIRHGGVRSETIDLLHGGINISLSRTDGFDTFDDLHLIVVSFLLGRLAGHKRQAQRKSGR